jgi:hypothetical protein
LRRFYEEIRDKKKAGAGMYQKEGSDCIIKNAQSKMQSDVAG